MANCIQYRPSVFILVFLMTLEVSVGGGFADTISGEGLFEDVNIPEDGSVFSTITIMDAGLIEDITITIQGIEHTNVGDLIAELRFLGNDPPPGPGGGNPAYLFFRPNVDDTDLLGSRGNLDGNYTFTTNQNDANFWSESAIPDDDTVDSSLLYFASDTNGDFHDLAGDDFFGGLNTVGLWQLVISDANDFGNNIGSVAGWRIDFGATVIPEPGAFVVLAFTVAALVRRRR